jgi:hypothetical protein
MNFPTDANDEIYTLCQFPLEDTLESNPLEREEIKLTSTWQTFTSDRGSTRRVVENRENWDLKLILFIDIDTRIYR